MLLNLLHSTSLFCVCVICLLSSCTNTGRYQQAKDSIPSRAPTLSEQINATPRFEKYSRGGNKDYTVRGKDYQVLSTADGYKETGIASFYGEKFHGHLTSNGEIYNMYSMSAAHKSLPLPSYVKVVNLNNHKTAIVRVNDRGPFHPGRIIDLSYSAAYKLGISGTANVTVEAITSLENIDNTNQKPNNNVLTTKKIEQPTALNPENAIINLATHNPIVKPDPSVLAQNLKKQFYIQVFLTSKPDVAKKIMTSLSNRYQKPVTTIIENKLHRVLLGPFNNKNDRILLLKQLKSSGYKEAFNKEIFQP